MEDDILIKNIRAINSKLNKEILDETIKENVSEIYKTYEYNTEDYVVETNKNGDNTLKIKVDGKYKYLTNKYNPKAEAKKFIQSIEKAKESIYIFFGIGLGYEAIEAIEYFEKDNLILIYEPDEEIYKAFVNNTDFSQYFNKENIVIETFTDRLDLLSKLNQRIDLINVLFVEHFVTSYYKEAYLEKYQVFLKELTEYIQATYMYRRTNLKYSKIWIENAVNNFGIMLDSLGVDCFVDKFKNMPLVMVSAGPSLDKNVHLLHEIKGKVPIFCVYTAYKKLLVNGIVPDFVIALDGQQTMHEKDDVRDLPIDTNFIYTDFCESRLVNRINGNKAYCIRNSNAPILEYTQKFDKGINTLLMGGSVACSLMDLARKTGADPIIMIGQDLAFTNKQHHASDTFYDDVDMETFAKAEVKLTKGIYGGFVETDNSFYGYLKWIEEYINNTKEECTYVDATEGGAFIENTEILTFKETIDKYCNNIKENKVEDIIKTIFSKNMFFNMEEKKHIAKDLYESFLRLEAFYKKIDDIIKDAKTLVDMYDGKYKLDQKRVNRILGVLDKADIEINEIGIVRGFIHDYLLSLLLILKANTRQNYKNEEKLLIAKNNQIIYVGYKETLDAVFDTIKCSVEELNNLYN